MKERMRGERSWEAPRRRPDIGRRAFVLLLAAGLALQSAALASVPARSETLWTLILQLPERGVLEVDRAGGRLRGKPSTLVPRLRRERAGMRGIRRLAAGTVSVECRRLRHLSLAGRMLVVTVAVPAGKRVRAVSTNRMTLSEDPGHLTLLNLQLVAEGELHARSPFAVVDEPGRTAVLFQ